MDTKEEAELTTSCLEEPAGVETWGVAVFPGGRENGVRVGGLCVLGVGTGGWFPLVKGSADRRLGTDLVTQWMAPA